MGVAFPRPVRPPGADRLVLLFSDIEMGAGGLLDDFPHSAWLAELLLAVAGGGAAGVPLDLVFHGDTFDFLKTSVDGAYHRHVDEDLAIAKLFRIVEAHPAFFDGLGRLLEGPGPRRRVHFVVGNHDYELVFPRVQAAVRRRIGADAGQVLFPGERFESGELRAEHGMQGDNLFRFDFDEPFVEMDGRPILNLPFGAIGIVDVALPLHSVLYHQDRLKPRDRVFEALPEVKELLVQRSWRYWTREYWAGWFRNPDPIKKFGWTAFREVAYRFMSVDPKVHSAAAYEDDLRTGPHSLIVLGHEHRAGWTSWGRRKLLKTGAFREEFEIEHDGEAGRALPKTYAEVWMRGDRVLTSQLVEVLGPPPPPGWLPASIHDVLPTVRELLGPATDRAHAADAQAAQVEAEKED